MILNLVEAVEVRSPLRRTTRYTIFLCADDECGQRFGVEVSGFHPRIVVEADFDTLTDIVDEAKVPWGDHPAPQVAVRSLSTQHLCGYQAAGGGVFEVTTDSPLVHQSVWRACQSQQLKVYRELSVEKQMIQSLGIEFGGCFDVGALRPGENPKRMRRSYRSVKAAANEHAPNPVVVFYDIETNNKKTKKFPNASMGDEVECIGIETSCGDRLLLSRFPVFRKMRAPYNDTEVRVFADERKLLRNFWAQVLHVWEGILPHQPVDSLYRFLRIVLPASLHCAATSPTMQCYRAGRRGECMRTIRLTTDHVPILSR